MRRSVVAWLLAATLLVSSAVLMIGPAGATTAKESSAALAAVTAAVDKTMAAGSANIRLQLSDGGAFGTAGKPLAGRGQYSFVDALGVVNMSPRLIFAVAQLYLHQPASRALDPAQKPWTFIALDSEEVQEEKYQGLLVQAESVNPLLILQLPKWGGVKAKKIGKTPGGSQTYAVTVDLKQAAANVTGPVQKPFVDGLNLQLTHRPRTTVTVTVDSTAASVEFVMHRRAVRSAPPPCPSRTSVRQPTCRFPRRIRSPTCSRCCRTPKVRATTARNRAADPPLSAYAKPDAMSSLDAV